MGKLSDFEGNYYKDLIKDIEEMLEFSRKNGIALPKEIENQVSQIFSDENGKDAGAKDVKNG